MKILHVGPVKNSSAVRSDDADFEILPGLGVDGPSRSILGLATGLAAAGVETAVLSTKPFQVPGNGLCRGVRFLQPYTGRKYNFFVRSDPWLERIESEFGRPDLVNFHDVYDLFSVALAAGMKKRGWKYIVTPRGGLRRFAQKRDGYKKKIANPLFFRRYLRNALFIHTLAEGEAAEVPLFDPTLKTVIVPNGLPLEFLSFCEKFPKSVKKESDELIVGFLGQIFVEIKGIDILFDAVKCLQQRGEGHNLKFILMGPILNTSDREWVGRMISDLPDPSRVVLTGPKFGREKWEVLNFFDVFVLPSRTEGMPVVALEAMAMGKPCLFSEGSNMGGVIERAAGGWRFDGTVDQLTKKLVEISKTPHHKFVELGQNARRCVKDRFTWDVVCRQYIEAVEGMLA